MLEVMAAWRPLSSCKKEFKNEAERRRKQESKVGWGGTSARVDGHLPRWDPRDITKLFILR